MRILKSHPLLKLVNSYLIDASQPSNISYLWNFGSLLLLCLIIQIITGVTLAMHYSPNVLEAFNSIEHMRDVNNGWLVRYLHSNTASAFFFLVYLHIGRGMYYGSYRAPRTLVWAIGTVILIVMIVTAFLGMFCLTGKCPYEVLRLLLTLLVLYHESDKILLSSFEEVFLLIMLL
uniref:Cytochrome b n=1 Tax=Podospora anserina TaxID=2587412 RepID=Q8LWV9_PODAS|nr:cytochrome b [Podospora anserina]